MIERPNGWIWAAVAWIGVIFFSSTSLASQWAETSYAAITSAVFGSSQENGQAFDLLHLVADKGFHVSLFCIFAILLWIALSRVKRKGLLILFCGAVVGSCSELLQRLFPDRDPAIRDVIINIGGTALGLLIAYAATQRRSTIQTAETAN